MFIDHTASELWWDFSKQMKDFSKQMKLLKQDFDLIKISFNPISDGIKNGAQVMGGGSNKINVNLQYD